MTVVLDLFREFLVGGISVLPRIGAVCVMAMGVARVIKRIKKRSSL